MNFQREALFPKLWEEMVPLFVRHWREIAHYQDIQLAPSIEFYRGQEEGGVLRAYTIRTEDSNELVGYCVYFVRPNPHYSGSLQAAQDVLFLAPEYRKGMVGAKFIKWCDERLKEEGVQAVYQHVKAVHDFGPMLERMGYEKVDIIYGKRLDRG